MKLKIELYRYGTLVFGKVLEMDEGLRAEYGKTRILSMSCLSQDAFYIYSEHSPKIGKRALYVRGNAKECDTETFVRMFDKEPDAIEFCSAISRLVAQVNGEATAEGVVKVM